MNTRFGPLLRHRSQIITLIVLVLAAMPIILANCTPGDIRQIGFPMSVATEFEYGWPSIWYWRDLAQKPGDIQPKWYVVRYSWLSLVGNVTIWFFILAVTWATSVWLMRRYRPTLRWSLRRMLAAIAAIAVLCAWSAHMWHLACIQDPLIAEIEGEDGLVYLERWGPKWLDFVGADRFRRRIVGANLYKYNDNTSAGLLNRLGRLPGLRFLDIEVEEWTPEIAAALGDLRKLRALRIEEVESSSHDDEERGSEESLRAIGKLKQLKILSVKCGSIGPDSLRHLAGLTDLGSLRLQIPYNGETEHELQHLVATRKCATLADLPTLQRLEFLGFYGGIVRADDLRRLASFRCLKALDLKPEFVTGEALVGLASLESLEELAIVYEVTSVDGLEALAGLKRLRRLHIASDIRNELAALRLDDGKEVFVQQNDLAPCHRALAALRHANPRIVIDGGDSRSFAEYHTLDKLRGDALLIYRWPQ